MVVGHDIHLHHAKDAVLKGSMANKDPVVKTGDKDTLPIHAIELIADNDSGKIIIASKPDSVGKSG